MIPETARPLVEHLLERCTFPEPGSALHCAVSGGPDSSALVILAAAAGCVVTAHHVDHGARPESAAEADVVAVLAARYGAAFVRHTTVVEPGSNFEARARRARFELMPPNIATGHTLDDRAETVLINMMRGAARTGLSPLQSADRHPIVSLRATETRELCKRCDVQTIEDPTNRDPAFVRNRVRHELMPLLDDISGRDGAAILDRQADVLGDEDRFLDALAAELDPTNAKAIAAAPIVLARRAMRGFIMGSWDRDHPPSADAVDRVLDVARGHATSCEIEGGHRVHRTNQRLRLEKPVDKVASS